MTDPLELLREYRETERLAGVRMWNALILSPTPEIWFTLLRGEPVPTDQLDRDYLRRARQRRV